MLLYPLATRHARSWILDLADPLAAPDLPNVYALVVPLTPPGIYIGATQNLAARVRQHLSRARTTLRRAAASGTGPGSTAAAVLRPVIAGRSGLLVLRLETAPRGNRQALQRLELAWLMVAAREELPLARRRGPRLQWSGDPSDLRAAFRLARTRGWPGQWIRALGPLCANRAPPIAGRGRAVHVPRAPETPAESANGPRPRAAGPAAAKTRPQGKNRLATRHAGAPRRPR